MTEEDGDDNDDDYPNVCYNSSDHDTVVDDNGVKQGRREHCFCPGMRHRRCTGELLASHSHCNHHHALVKSKMARRQHNPSHQALSCYNEALLAAPADPWDGQVKFVNKTNSILAMIKLGRIPKEFVRAKTWHWH